MLLPLMSNYADEIAFIREVLFDVNDETPRQVYADWLEERGDRRADFLPIDFVMHETDSSSEMFKQLRAQRDQLIRGLDSQWVALLAGGQLSLARDETSVCFVLKIGMRFHPSPMIRWSATVISVDVR